ncbi:MAG: tRNA pseudouridine(55) synthase TruB [Actinomycetota bacterium]
MDGVLIVDKPPGMTSHDVVDAVRARLGTKRVGHAGTLDPDATGVLILGLGAATRLLSVLQNQPKSYRAAARFGSSTTTQDASGEVVRERAAAHLEESAVSAALARFTGAIEQIPPMVSAVKVGGERLYRKALRGEEVERAARAVTVYRFDLVGFTPGESPDAVFEIDCSAGTYVRTLVHDLGEALGTGAHLTSLRRTAAGGFDESECVDLERVAPEDVRPLLDAVVALPRVEVDADQARLVSDGRALDPARVPHAPPAGTLFAVVHRERLLALYERKGDELRADRVMPR